MALKIFTINFIMKLHHCVIKYYYEIKKKKQNDQIKCDSPCFLSPTKGVHTVALPFNTDLTSSVNAP